MTSAAIDAVFAPELVRCIAEGRDPDVTELFQVARRVWTEARIERSAFAWDRLDPRSTEKVGALRVAQAALSGR